MTSQFYITQEHYDETWYTIVASLFLLALILCYAYSYLPFSRWAKPLSVRTDQDAPIYKLPPELIQLIATFLHPPSAALFGLSNKSVLSAIGSQVFKLEKPYRLYCLEALQPQLPNYLICHVCVSFHRRCNHRSSYLGYEEPACYNQIRLFRYGVTVGEFSLLFSDVQQIMNRHRFGEKHGISVKDIEVSRYGYFSRFPAVSVTETAEARISDEDKLLLRIDSRSRFDPHDTQLKKTAIYAPHEFCPHVSDFDLNLYNFINRKKPFIKCSKCKTETRIRINTVGPQYELQTTSWYTLGSGRDPFDPDDSEWKTVTEKPSISDLIPSSEKQAVCRRAFKAALPG